MGWGVEQDDLGDILAGVERDQAVATRQGMEVAGLGLKGELRDQVRAAALGQRLANTWQARIYPQVGASLESTAYLFSRAPLLIDAFNRDLMIGPDGHRYRAIPTANVPPARRSGHRGLRMTPLDVETAFNQDLIIRQGRGRHRLAFVDVVAARSGVGYRPGTKRRMAQGRQRKLVLMFTLVPEPTHHRKRLDIEGAADRWAARVPDLIVERWRS